jgi:hydroxymethylpyrimidine pyrophosphatase-like HAD family hydrolase
MQWYLNDRLQIRDERLRRIEDLSHAFRDKVVCLTVIGEQHSLHDLERVIKDMHRDAVEIHCYQNQYSSDWFWLTIHDSRATKDRAIQIVLDEFGLNECELVVFGDQNNDIKMFQLADRAIAVSNAIQELKGHATQIIGSNQEDSVVKFIYDDWKNTRHLAIA